MMKVPVQHGWAPFLSRPWGLSCSPVWVRLQGQRAALGGGQCPYASRGSNLEYRLAAGIQDKRAARGLDLHGGQRLYRLSGHLPPFMSSAAAMPTEPYRSVRSGINRREESGPAGSLQGCRHLRSFHRPQCAWHGDSAQEMPPSRSGAIHCRL